MLPAKRLAGMVAIDGLRDDVRVGRASLPSSTDSQERLQTMSDRRDEIIEVAKEVFADHGVRASTVREIGSRAGILSGSLYHHFPSKLAIVDAILRDFCQEVLSHYDEVVAAHPDPVDALRAMAAYAFTLARDHSAAVQILLADSETLIAEGDFGYLVDFNREVEGHWLRNLEAGVAAGRLRDDVDVRIVYRFAREAILGSIRWYSPDGRWDHEAVSRQFGEILLGGLEV